MFLDLKNAKLTKKDKAFKEPDLNFLMQRIDNIKESWLRKLNMPVYGVHNIDDFIESFRPKSKENDFFKDDFDSEGKYVVSRINYSLVVIEFSKVLHKHIHDNVSQLEDSTKNIDVWRYDQKGQRYKRVEELIQNTKLNKAWCLYDPNHDYINLINYRFSKSRKKILV